MVMNHLGAAEPMGNGGTNKADPETQIGVNTQCLKEFPHQHNVIWSTNLREGLHHAASMHLPLYSD